MPKDKDWEPQPHDEVIAAGEHMNLDENAENVERERIAGAVLPTGVVLAAPSARPNPYVTEEDQGMQMEPKTFGPPQYGSPDPATSASRLMTLEDGHPLDGLPEDHPAAISEDYATSPAQGEPAAESDEEIDATDGAKELADQEGVDLSQVEGTGADGRITKSDVEDFIAERDQS